MATRFGSAAADADAIPVSPRDGDDHTEDDYGSPRSDSTTDLNSVLRIMAETQRMMLLQQQSTGKTRILANVKIPEFDGADGTTVRKYQQWRKSVEIVRKLNNLTEVNVFPFYVLL